MSAVPSNTTLFPAARTSTATRLRFLGVVRSEWRKFLSLRSLLSTALGTAVLGIAMATLYTQLLGYAEIPTETHLPMSLSIALGFQGILLLALGAVIVSSEFTKGAAVTTFTAVPRRGWVFGAKLIVVVVLALFAYLISLATTLIGITAANGGAALETAHWPDIARLTLVPLFYALFGFSFAWMLRSSAGAITAGLGTIFGLQILVAMMTSAAEVFDTILTYLPMSLLASLTSDAGGGTEVSVTTAALGLTAWIIVPLAIGAVTLRRRDIA
ncbi:MAG: ABC transporter permease subunit [Bowdeniella nasicola]|nr:ABC transporter permease subunit [Bowdeniella nasicola]